MEFVQDVCDRVALARGGSIVRMGPTVELLAETGFNERMEGD
ncbi:MAG: hypothetical protein WCK53_03195 [Methanomicrobiales archaeon]